MKTKSIFTYPDFLSQSYLFSKSKGHQNRKNGTIKAVLTIFVIVSIFVLSSCEKTEPEADLFDIQGENGFVGTLDGTNALIALLVADEEAIVYVCNGEEEISEWFNGKITDPENISLTNSTGAQIVGKFAGSLFTGSVVLSNATTHSFTAGSNTGNETGIFRVYGDLAMQESLMAGWILNSENEVRGSFRLKSVFQATPKKPKTNFGDITDGTSNTLSFNNKSFPIQRFIITTHFTKNPDFDIKTTQIGKLR